MTHGPANVKMMYCVHSISVYLVPSNYFEIKSLPMKVFRSLVLGNEKH
jgi:hypothetical protein